MPNDPGYCRRKAAECAERAEKTSDTEIHEYLIRMRDVWIAAANRFEFGGVLGRTEVSPGLSRLAFSAAIHR